MIYLFGDGAKYLFCILNDEDVDRFPRISNISEGAGYDKMDDKHSIILLGYSIDEILNDFLKSGGNQK